METFEFGGPSSRKARKGCNVWMWGVGGVVLVAFLLTFGIVFSTKPNLCPICHEMEEPYEQWQTSSHHQVNCFDCHVEPSLSGIANIYLMGGRHIVKHLAGQRYVSVQARISDASCLMCHKLEERPESIKPARLRVAHSAHKGLACAVCHVRLVHLSAGQRAWVNAAPKPHVVRTCTVCHTPENCPHGAAKIECVSCHQQTIPNHDLAQKRGVFPREGCIECHERERVSSPENCLFCHESPHGVDAECSRCHTSTQTWSEHTFEHPVKLEGKHAELNCNKCHTKRLTAYECTNCHTPPKDHYVNECVRCHQAGGDFKAAGANHVTFWPWYKGRHAQISCAECHKKDEPFSNLPTKCVGCHEPPGGNHFGAECELCHSPERPWESPELKHPFPQDHATANKKCEFCHPDRDYTTYRCLVCHSEAGIRSSHPDQQIKELEGKCASCHPTGQTP